MIIANTASQEGIARLDQLRAFMILMDAFRNAEQEDATAHINHKIQEHTGDTTHYDFLGVCLEADDDNDESGVGADVEFGAVFMLKKADGDVRLFKLTFGEGNKEMIGKFV